MVLMPKRAHSRSNLRVRTLVAMVKARPSRPRPLTLWFLTGPTHALSNYESIRKIAVIEITVMAPPKRVATCANGMRFMRFAVLRIATSPVPPMPL